VSTQPTICVADDAVADDALEDVAVVGVIAEAEDVFVEPPPHAAATAPRPKVPSKPRARRRSMWSDMGQKLGTVPEREVDNPLCGCCEPGSRHDALVQIVEVSPRDGLQAEDIVLNTPTKVELIGRAVAAGVRRIEVASFVNPKRVPQMADGEAVVAALPHRDDVTWIGLVLNRRGVERAIATGLREVNGVVVCTDTFGERNQGVTAMGSVEVFGEIATAACAAGVRPTATISVAFGCPYEGEVPVARLADIAKRCADAGATEIAIADTIGVADPVAVTERIEAVRASAPDVPLRAHFHNTRNTGIANAYAAVQAGVDALDASLGGIGGCPFAPNATGNIPTEDLAFMLERMGIDTGLDLAALIDIVPWIEERLGKRVPGLLAKAGLFPR
jgi:hydroxymethylglutaryl-CoA lyase